MGDSFIIAVDFGTAYSGYAFNVTPRGKDIEPTVRLWGEEIGLHTPKTPTCILFNEDGEFIHFGYEAKSAYTNMRGEEARKHYLFENFKMALYGSKLNRDVMIKAANGKEMEALKVFTAALKFLKDDALETISKNAVGKVFVASDFTWVLTVPAIWDPSAKQFMREAATQAGIVTKQTEDKLIIALEPEAASVWCKKLPADGFMTQNHGRKKLEDIPGTQYIVVDCGGGTIDITVHEIQEGGGLKELHKASGNDHGGQTVDTNFKLFLREIFSDELWDEYEEKYPSDVQKLMYDFTSIKQVDEDVQICCSFNLGSLAEKTQEIKNYFESVQGASWDDGWIKITKQKLNSLFDESLRCITENLREILNKDLNIGYILLVGGYAQSLILRQHITEEFSDNCKVLCPFSPQEAVVKGAVMFGRNPEMVLSRKSVYTYGVATTEPFDDSRHSEDKKFTADGVEWCCDIFMKLMEVDKDVGCNETIAHIFSPVESYQTGVKMRFYRTERQTLMYVDEWGVEEVGSFHINIPDIAAGRKRKVRLEIRFGATEITATGIDLMSGSTASVKIDFMTKL